MTAKEKVKNDVLIRMKYHLDSTAFDILGNVLIEVLSGVEVAAVETLPATVDDSNKYILELFQLNKAPKLSQKTVNFYMDSIQHLICTVNKPLTKITTMDIEMFLNSIRKDNSAVSLNNQRRNISAFFTWMRKSHIILENPCENIDPYKEDERPIDHMEPEEFEQLKSGCRHKRDRAMIEFLRSTALRVGEVEGIKVSDIDWRSGQLTVYGEKGHAYRPVCLDSVAMKYIGEYVEERGIQYNSNEQLFTQLKNGQHEGLSKEGIRGAILAIKNRAELERRVYPHLFRKTTATNIVKRGGSVHDAGEYLGHKDRTTAGRHYAYISKDHTIEIFNRFVATV